MITQRPVTGSRRSSGTPALVERRSDTRSRRYRPRIAVNRYHVEPARPVNPPLLHHIRFRQPHNRPPLPHRHRFRRIAEIVILARLDLDEYQRLAVTRNDVNFARATAPSPGNNCVPASFEFGDREISPVLPSATRCWVMREFASNAHSTARSITKATKT
jgi:hypothetical protein